MDIDQLQNAYDALKRVHNATNQAVEQLTKDLEASKVVNLMLGLEKKQWELEKQNQQMVIQQTIDRSNDTSNRYLEENDRLRRENTELKKEIKILRGE